MSASSAFVHPLTALRAKLEELAGREDADQLERLLEGEGMPLFGGQEEPAELLHRALLRQPYQPELFLSLAPLLAEVLKRLAAALEKETLPPQPALGRTVRNALLLAELVPPAAPIFEGVAAVYEPLAGYAISAEQEKDRYALGQRLRAALTCQQDDDRFADFWSSLLKSASSTDLLDGLRGLLWLPVASEPYGSELVAQGLKLFAKSALGHPDQPMLLRWAITTLANSLPHSPEYWQKHLAPLAAGWPAELRVAFQERWPTVELAEPAQPDEPVPRELLLFWQRLTGDEQAKILAVRGDAAASNQLWQRELTALQLKPRGGMSIKEWMRQAKAVRAHFESPEGNLPAQRTDLVEVEIDELEEERRGPRLHADEALRRIDKVMAEVEAKLRQGQKERGLKYVEDLIEAQRRSSTSEQVAKTISRAANLFLRYEHLDQAQTLLQEAIDLVPEDPFPYTGLAEVLKSRGELAEAERLYRETVTRFPSDVVARTGLAEVLKSRGELPEAERLYRETVTRFPSDVVARNGLANLLRQLRRFDEALGLMPEPAQLKTRQDYINLHLRGMIFLSQGNLAEAKRLLERGLRECSIEVSLSYYRNALAVLALRQARWEDVDQLVSADTSPVGKVLQFHARAGSGRAEDAGELARELQAAKILPFSVRRAFEGIRDGYDVFAPSGLRNPSPEEEEQIFEYEFEMLSSGIAA